jgi:hypothetical protein
MLMRPFVLLKAGKPVLVEKPLGTTVAECKRLATQVRDSKLIAQVGTMKRFDPGIRDAQRFLAEEGGEILALKAWYCDSIYRYVETDNLQPVMVTSAAIYRPKGNQRLTCESTTCSGTVATSLIPRFSWSVQFVPCEPPLRKSSTVSAG